ASPNLNWFNASQRLGIGTISPQANVHVSAASGLSTMIVGNASFGGTIYFAATGNIGLGLCSITTNATWNGSAWQQTDSIISSWQMGFRNAHAFDTETSMWSVRYMPPGSPPNLFPNSRLAVTDRGVGIATDFISQALDVRGNVRI